MKTTTHRNLVPWLETDGATPPFPVGSVSIATRYRILVGARYSAPVQTGPEAHPTSYTMGIGSLLGRKAAGVWR